MPIASTKTMKDKVYLFMFLIIPCGSVRQISGLKPLYVYLEEIRRNTLSIRRNTQAKNTPSKNPSIYITDYVFEMMTGQIPYFFEGFLYFNTDCVLMQHNFYEGGCVFQRLWSHSHCSGYLWMYVSNCFSSCVV